MNKEKQSVSRMRRLKNWIKKKRHSSNFLVRWIVEGLFRVARLLYTVKGLLTDKQYRTICYLKLFHSKHVHQTTPATCMNRYPNIFSACKNYFGDKEDIRILSFGCSTGEEVITLRYYFPKAVIVGAEINPHSLEICNNRQVDEKICFITSTPEEIKKHGPYDAIFCMAVFQRTPQLIAEKKITDLSKIYPFQKFENQIIELDESVKENGLFIVYFSQYDFQDTKVASNYKVYGNYYQEGYGPFIFDRNNQLVREPSIRHSIFIKN